MADPTPITDLPGEEWRFLRHVEPAGLSSSYQVSNLGRVRSVSRLSAGKHPKRLIGRIMRSHVTRLGYLGVFLRHGGESHHFMVHRLVLRAFVGLPNGLISRHLDGNPGNAALSNLRYGTQKENTADARRHGRLALGDRNGVAKLKNSEAQEIRKLRAEGVSARALAKRFGVCETTVRNIVTRVWWVHLP